MGRLLGASLPYGASSYGAPSYGAPETSGKAVAALALGICSFVLWFVGPVLAILAIVFGVLARRDVAREPHRLKGQGVAAWGIGLGAVNLAFAAVLLAAIVFVLVSDLGEAGNSIEVTLTKDEIDDELTVARVDPGLLWDRLRIDAPGLRWEVGGAATSASSDGTRLPAVPLEPGSFLRLCRDEADAPLTVHFEDADTGVEVAHFTFGSIAPCT